MRTLGLYVAGCFFILLPYVPDLRECIGLNILLIKSRLSSRRDEANGIEVNKVAYIYLIV
jgi:hypothetical protein